MSNAFSVLTEKNGENFIKNNDARFFQIDLMRMTLFRCLTNLSMTMFT